MNHLGFFFRHTFLLGLLFVTACSAPVMQAGDWQDPALSAVWPPPPQPPRVKLLRAIGAKTDLQQEQSSQVFRWLFGESAGQFPLVSPYGIAADGNGRVWVADPGGSMVHIFDLASNEVEYISQVGNSKLVSPVGLAYNPRLKLFYLSDSALNRVFALGAQGDLAGEMNLPGGFSRPAGLAVGPDDSVFVADVPSGKLEQFSATGQHLRSIVNVDGVNSLFNHPTNVAVDRQGRIYVTDSMNFRVIVQSPEGEQLSVIGGIGDRPGNLARPRGVAVDSEGHVYVVDAAFDNVQIFDMAGRLLLYFGQPGKAGGEFCLPAGIFIDQQDRIYLSESCNGRFQIFQYLKESN